MVSNIFRTSANATVAAVLRGLHQISVSTAEVCGTQTDNTWRKPQKNWFSESLNAARWTWFTYKFFFFVSVSIISRTIYRDATTFFEVRRLLMLQSLIFFSNTTEYHWWFVVAVAVIFTYRCRRYTLTQCDFHQLNAIFHCFFLILPHRTICFPCNAVFNTSPFKGVWNSFMVLLFVMIKKSLKTSFFFNFAHTETTFECVINV